MLLFVYGTLKRSIRDPCTLKDMKYLGCAETKDKYIMYSFIIEDSKLSAPFVNNIGELNDFTNIKGELYDVNDETLLLIDDREGSPGWYNRVLVEVTLKNEVKQAYMYINNKVFKNMDYESWGLDEPIVIKDGNYSRDKY